MSFHQIQKKVHIDIDPSSINKNVKVDLPLVGDVKLVLTSIIKTIKKRNQILLNQIIIIHLNGGKKLTNGDKKSP